MLSRLSWQALVAVLALAWLAPPAGAGEAAPTLELQTRRVVVFKDGHALVVKEGRGRTDAEGSLVTDQGPTQAVLGTLWVADAGGAAGAAGSPSALTVERLQREERRTSPGVCRSLIEIVAANLGKNAVVSRREGGDLEGKLLAVLDSPAPAAREAFAPEAASPYAAWSARPAPAPEPGGDEAWRPATGDLFVLRTSQGDVVLGAAEVRALRVPDMATRLERAEVRSVPANRLRVRFPGAKAGETRALRLLYLRPGLRWVPTYQVSLDGGSVADVSLQAEVLNEAEDLAGAPVDFVVGLPTFRFKEVSSPLTLERALRQALAVVAPDLDNSLGMQQSFGNVYQDPRARRLRPAPEGAGDEQFSLVEKAMGGSEVQDLFFYSAPSLTLGRGERAAVGLFHARVPVRHIYTWEPRLPHGAAGPMGGSGSPLRPEVNEVWHQLVLENRSPVPWTTGPALVLDAGRPVGQDLITFTPPGREVTLPVTAAVSVRGTVQEVELGRERRAEKWRGSYYSRVTQRAELRVSNALKTPVHLVLQPGVGGRAIKASQRGVIQVGGHDPADGLEELNPHSSVRWELELKAGEEAAVQVTYQTLVAE